MNWIDDANADMERRRQERLANPITPTQARSIYGGVVARPRKDSAMQSKLGKRAGDKNVETGWAYEFAKIGQDIIQAQTTCPKCGTEGTYRIMKRWHFDKCDRQEFYDAVPWTDFKYGQLVEHLNGRFPNVRGHLNQDSRFTLVKKGHWRKS